MKLRGKIILVTGGNSGIGLATAKEFKEQGARVVITGRDQQTLDAAKREIGGDVLALPRTQTASAHSEELPRSVYVAVAGLACLPIGLLWDISHHSTIGRVLKKRGCVLI